MYRKAKNMKWENNLTIYKEVIAKCPRFKFKGKTMPYTSANGYMFSLLNKAGELGIRFSKDVQEKHMKELDTTYFKSYNAVMRGYILIPERILSDTDKLSEYLNESFDFVMSLDSK